MSLEERPSAKKGFAGLGAGSGLEPSNWYGFEDTAGVRVRVRCDSSVEARQSYAAHDRGLYFAQAKLSTCPM